MSPLFLSSSLANSRIQMWLSTLVLSASLTMSLPAQAADVGAGLVPLAAIPAIAAVGGAFSIVMMSQALASDEKMSSGLRDFALILAGINAVSGIGGLVVTTLVDGDEYTPFAYTASGVVLALAAAGLTLGLLVDTWDVPEGYK
jgi:hypothetical protein